MTNQHDHHVPPPPLAECDSSSPNNLDNDNNALCYTPTRALEIVRERHQVDMSNEDMDPIEWTVRKLVPIPAMYYWDVSVLMSDQKDMTNHENVKTKTPSAAAAAPQQHQPMSSDMIPWKIRLWHESIYSLCIAGDFITRRIAQPIGIVLGLTQSSSFSYVFDNMTRQEWEASQKRAMEQRRKNEQRRRQEQAENVPTAEQTECLEDKI